MLPRSDIVAIDRPTVLYRRTFCLKTLSQKSMWHISDYLAIIQGDCGGSSG